MEIQAFELSIPANHWERGEYIFRTLDIYIKGFSSIDELRTNGENSPAFVTLCHEYIHYIQNFTTTSSAAKFLNYIAAFTSTCAENGISGTCTRLPLFGGYADKTLGPKNFNNFIRSLNPGFNRNGKKFSFWSTPFPDDCISKDLIKNPYSDKHEWLYYLSAKGKKVPLNELVISENMALAGSYIASKIPLDEISKSITSELWGLQYNVIYQFIHTQFPTKNCIKLTYQICEASLLLIPCSDTAFKILLYLKNNKITLSQLDEDGIISQALRNINFQNSVEVQLSGLIACIDKRVGVYNKHSHSVEFNKTIISVLGILRAGLVSRKVNISSYADTMGFDFIENFSRTIYSPIIKFENGDTTILNHNPTIINELATFSGIMRVFYLGYKSNISECPFCNDGSLCGHPNKGAICKSNPKGILTNPIYSGCLLDNGLRLLNVTQ